MLLFSLQGFQTCWRPRLLCMAMLLAFPAMGMVLSACLPAPPPPAAPVLPTPLSCATGAVLAGTGGPALPSTAGQVAYQWAGIVTTDCHINCQCTERSRFGQVWAGAVAQLSPPPAPTAGTEPPCSGYVRCWGGLMDPLLSTWGPWAPWASRGAPELVSGWGASQGVTLGCRAELSSGHCSALKGAP